MRRFLLLPPLVLSLLLLAGKGGVRGNYTPLNNLHITLAFIGEYRYPERVLAAMKTVAFEPFHTALSGFGAFDRLYWVGLSGAEKLSAYAARLREALAEAGIPYDKKRFSSHITVLRQADRPAGAISVKNVELTADRVYLMRSDRGPQGMIYTPVGSVCAGGTEK